MTNLTQIGKTMSQELQRAIDAALEADAMQIECVISDMNDAYKMMMDGIERVRGMEIEIANMTKAVFVEREAKEAEIAKWLKAAIVEREKVEDEYHARMEGHKKLLGVLRGSKLTGPKIKMVEGGK